MLRGCFLLLVIGLSATQVAGQVNLVPNGSFEVADSCPTGFGQIEFAQGWYTPTNSTPDFIHECSFAPSYSVPPPWSDSVYPFDGSAMVYFALYGQGNAREYISIGLIDDLVESQSYLLSLQLRVPNDVYANVGSIGAEFSSDTLVGFTGSSPLIAIQPDLQRDPNQIINELGVWVEYSDWFIAAGGENHVTIGNFLPNSQTPVEIEGNSIAGYFIDAISLVEFEPDAIQEFSIDASIGPNPAKDHLTITSNHPKLDISILSIAGQVLQTEQLIGSGNHQLNLNGLSAGVYFVRMQTSEGERVKKLVIH